MFNKRNSSVGRRLRMEALELRDVPSAVDGVTDPNQIDPNVPVQIAINNQPTNVDPTVVINLNDPVTLASTTSVVADPTTTSAGPAVDLATTMSIDRPKPSIGDTVTIKVTLANNGPVQATGVQVTTALPAGMTFVSADLGLSKFDPTTGIWSAGTLAAKGKVTLTLKAKVTDAATQTIATSITHSDQSDDKTDNNSAQVSVAPVLAALNLSKTTSTPAAAIGSTVVFTLAVGNSGKGMARGVVVNDTVGSGLGFAKVVSASQGAYNPSTGVWNVGAIPAGTIAVLRVAVTINTFARIDSPATLSATGYDAAKSKLDATVAVTGVKAAGLSTASYFSGVNFGFGATPVPAAAKVSIPTTPITIVNGTSVTTAASLNAYLLAHGFKFPAL